MRHSILSTRGALGSAVAVSALLLAVPALAQQAETPPSDTIEEVIVTVQKREQAIKDVPATITAYGGAQLERTGITEFDKLSTFVPGFEVQNQSPNNPGFVVRGLTSDSLSGYSEPRVSVFQDGVSITRSAGSYIELYDIERVEIAKGPQSTLFGRGSLIGGINVIQKKAKIGAFDASGAVSFGNFNARSLEGMVNLPMGETFALRVSGRVAERDGYVKNLLGGDLNSQDTRAGRIAARWAPMDGLTFDLIGNYQKDEPAATAFKSHLVFPSNLTTGAVTGTLKPQDAAALALPKGFLGGKAFGLDREVYGLTLISNYQISDSLKLNSTTAWRGFEATETGDSDGTAAEIISFANVAKGRQWSQEFRLNFDDGGPVSWFAGVGYFQEKASDATPAQFDERYALAQLAGQLNMSAFGSGLGAGRIAPSAFFANPAVTGALLQGVAAAQSGNRLLLSAPLAQAIAANLKTGHLETARDQSELTSWDVFGDVTFRPTDKLTLGVGLRYTRDDKTTRFDSAVLNGRSILGGVIGAATVASAGDPVSVGTANALATALAAPGAANIPTSAFYPVPMFGLTFQPTNGNGAVVSQDLDYGTLTWRLTALYELNEELNLYANYARGQRPQVLAVRAPSAPFGAPNFQPLKAEKVDSLEGGFKLATADRRLRWDTALFYYRYNNFETTEQIGTRFVSTNAGKATGYGLETQATWRVMPMTELFGTYAYNHSRFDSGAYKGNRFRLTPDHSLSFGASVRFAAMGGEVELMPTYTWQSKIYFDDNNDKPSLQSLASGKLVPDLIQDEFQKAYGLLGLRIAYAPEGRNWRFEAYGENLTDVEYIMDAGNTGDGIGMPTMVTGAPRTYGVKVRYSY